MSTIQTMPYRSRKKMYLMLKILTVFLLNLTFCTGESLPGRAKMRDVRGYIHILKIKNMYVDYIIIS